MNGQAEKFGLRERAHLDVVQEGIQLVVLAHEVVERPDLAQTKRDSSGGEQFFTVWLYSIGEWTPSSDGRVGLPRPRIGQHLKVLPDPSLCSTWDRGAGAEAGAGAGAGAEPEPGPGVSTSAGM